MLCCVVEKERTIFVFDARSDEKSNRLVFKVQSSNRCFVRHCFHLEWTDERTHFTYPHL